MKRSLKDLIFYLLIAVSITSCEFGSSSSSDDNSSESPKSDEKDKKGDDEGKKNDDKEDKKPDIELILNGLKDAKFLSNKSQVTFLVNFSQKPARDLESTDFKLTGDRPVSIEKKSEIQFSVTFSFDKSKPTEELKLTFFASKFNEEADDVVWDLYFDQEAPVVEVKTSDLITDSYDINIGIQSDTDGDLNNQSVFVKNGTLKSLTKTGTGRWTCVVNPTNRNARTNIKVYIKENQIEDLFNNGNLKSNELNIDYNPETNVVRMTLTGNQATFRQDERKFYASTNHVVVEVNFSKNVPAFALNQIQISENLTLDQFQKLSDKKFRVRATWSNPSNPGRIGINKNTVQDENRLTSNHQDEIIELHFLPPIPDIDTPANDPTVVQAKNDILDKRIGYAHSHAGVQLGGPTPGDDKIYSIDVPYSPFNGRNAPATTLIFQYVTSKAQAYFAAKLPKKLIARLPDPVKQALRTALVADVDLYFVIQDAPGEEHENNPVDYSDVAMLPSVKTHYLLDSWQFNRDLPPANYDYIQEHFSGIFDTGNNFLRDYAPTMRRDFQRDSINIHPESVGNPVTIFSGNSGHIGNAELRKNYAFWSVVASHRHNKAAVTLHWTIVNKLEYLAVPDQVPTDIEFQNSNLRAGYFNPQCAAIAGCNLRGFIGYLDLTYATGGPNPNRPKTRKMIESLSEFLQ